jgi:hypothetical protein
MQGRDRQANRGQGGFRRRLRGLYVCAAAALCIPLLASGGEVAGDHAHDAILATVRAYVVAVYARDYAAAYGWISAADRRLKSQADYEQDNEPFTGATLTLAQRLAQAIVIRDAAVERLGERATVRAQLSLPNGNAEEVSALLLSGDGFAEAPRHELGERLTKLEALIASGKLPMIEVQETWELVRDPEGWRIFLDWASGVRLRFNTQVPRGLEVSATLDRAEVLTPRGETVQLRLAVHNQSAQSLRLKVIHRVEPAAVEKELDLIQCGFLFPQEVAAGEVHAAPMVYFVDEEAAKGLPDVRVTLEFVVLE